MSNRFSRVIFTVLVLLYTGCRTSAREETISIPTPLVITSTLPVTSTAFASATVPPLTAPPILVPVEGITSTQLNVRAEPSTASEVLGIIPANTKVEIVGKDPGESWWQINYPQAADGKGWVTAQYVTTTNKPEVPVIGGNQADPNQGNVAIVQQQINVRSGPGTDFNSLGTLNPQDVVDLLGKDADGAWLQIDFPAGDGPEGKGWVNAAFVQAQGVENLPIITETGLIVGTGTPTGIPFTPTPTLVPAWDDRDSSSHPVASIIFDKTGTRTMIYNGDLSSPEGDVEDWIAFKPDGTSVFASLACIGSSSLDIELTENSSTGGIDIACGDWMKQIPVKAGSNYLIHLQARPSTGNLQYTNYILTITMSLS